MDTLQDLLGSFDNKKEIEKEIKPRKKRKSIFDVEQEIIPEQEPIIIPADEQDDIQQEIVIPQSIQEEHTENVLKQIQKQDAFQNIRQQIIQRQKDNKQQESDNDEIKQTLDSVRAEPIPEGINISKVESDVTQALNEIPDGNDYNMINVDIKASTVAKDKSGYYKTKVSIKKDGIPEQINTIASYVKKHSKGVISPRVCDLRVIGNTNKTQLRGSVLKLTTATIVFKPDFKKLKVNKGTRFMLSIPDNYDTTGNLLVYIQESRSKKILEITAQDFPSVEIFNKFIGDAIINYYNFGYDVTLKKLELRNVNNPLMSILTNIVGTGEYKAKPYVEDSNIYAVDFISKTSANDWLIVNISESNVTGIYEISAFNTVDQSKYNVASNVTMEMLRKDFYDTLEKLYSKDWSKELNITSEDEIYYLLGKLTHSKMKNAIVEMYDLQQADESLGIVFAKTMSKKETAKIIDDAYEAEAIIGKTTVVDSFILTYLAKQIKGGDKRKGSEYITSDAYYEKYGVSNKADYDKRKKTILAKQGTERNYDARIYVFQIEYSVAGKKHIYITEKFSDILTETAFIGGPVSFPISKY